MGSRHGGGLIVGEVRGNGDLDLFLRDVDQHHLKRADRDLQTAQQLADALAVSRGGVLDIVAVCHRTFSPAGA